MSKLLLFIGENQKFDINSVTSLIAAMPGVSDARWGSFIGATFECNYSYAGMSTLVRLSPDAETITVEGLTDDALSFVLELQKRVSVDLSMVDMDYSFHVDIRNFHSIDELRGAVQGS